MSQEKSISRSRLHSVQLENRTRAILTGVNDVDSFHEAEVNLMTEDGYMTITGQELHISRLSLEEGQLVVEGQITGIQYADSDGHGNFLARLFRG